MADDTVFNLSAAISLQLAEGAAKSLKKQVGKIDSIAVPVTFKQIDRVGAEAKLKKIIKPIPIGVKWDRDSVKANLTEPALLAMMTKAQKNIVIPISVKWDKDTASKIKSVEKQIEKLVKLSDKLKAAAGVNTVGVDPASIKVTNAAIEDTNNEVNDLIDSLKKLSKQSNDTKFGDVKNSKNFFEQANNQIDRLRLKLEKLGATNGIDKLKEKFQGLGGDTAGRNNLLNSLRTLFKGLTDLRDKQREVEAAGKTLGASFNMNEAKLQIKSARAEITSLFDSMASSDPSTFAISMTSAVKKVSKETGQAITAATRDIRSFNTLISSINQKRASAVNSGASQGTIDNFKKLIDEAEAQQKKGVSTDLIKSSPRFQEINALLGNLKYIEQAAKRAEGAMDNLTRKASKELKNSEGGQLLGLDANAKKIGRRASAKIAGTRDPAEIAKITDIAKNEYNELAQRADKANKQFGRLDSQIIKLQESNFTNAANSLKAYRIQLEHFIKTGASIQDIDKDVTRELAKALNLQGLDGKINTALKQIDRLRNALNFSPVDDIGGAKPALDHLEDNLKKGAGKFANLTPDSLDKEVSKGLFDIRGMQRFNEAADTTRAKLGNISDAFEDLGKVAVYDKYADNFERQSRKIAASSDSVGSKLQQLKKLSEKTLIGAKLDSEGGFFGSIARSAGLATKRLAAFLVLAQGLYSIQSVFSTAASDAVKLDKEFTRLEQVFNKDLTGSKLVQSLKFTTNQIKELSVELGISTLEVASAAQVLAQAGIYGRDLEKLLGTISKSQLGPSFGSASETAEASIAIFKQFNLTAEDTQKALGGINRISAKYAVEAKGITEAVRRAGGVFASSGDGIGSFAAAFTLVKQKTREADEAIATGLRNIAQRLQTSNTQEKIKEALGINLVDNGEFVGFEKSIERIGEALKLKGVSSNSPLFSQIREIIGGTRQGSRVTPLLQDFEQFKELRDEFGKGAKSIDEDVKVAFQSIENKLARAKAAVQDLFHEIISSDLAKFLVDAFTSITIFATRLLKTLNSIPGAILSIGVAAKLLGQGKFIGQAFLSHFATRTSPIALPKNKGGPIGFNGGSKGGTGLIPGGGPNKDSLLAYLTTGEYVLQRKAVKKYGTTFLDNLNDGTINANKGGPIRRNSGGIIPGFNTGGLLDLLKSAGFNLKADDLKNLVTKFTVGPLKAGVRGSANVKEKSIKLAGLDKLETLAHEFGHIVTARLDKSKTVRIFENLPDELKKSTKARVESRPDVYGEQGTAKYQRSIQRETLADATKELAGRSTNKNSIANRNVGNKGFAELEQGIQDATGVTIKRGKTYQKPKRIVKERFDASNILTSVPYDGSFSDSGSNGGKSTFKKQPKNFGNLFPISSKIGSKISSGASSTVGSVKGLGAVLPTGGLLSFGKSLLQTKGGLAGLASAFFVVQGLLGGVNSGFTDLISAMGTAALSMYTLTKVTAIRGFAQNAASGGVKRLTSVRAKGIGETFKESVGYKARTYRNKTKGIFLPPGPVTKLDPNTLAGHLSSERGKLANLSRSSKNSRPIIDSILATKAKVAPPKAIKSAGAIANLAAAKNLGPLGNTLKGFAGSSFKLVKGLNVAAIGVGLMVGALDFFVGSLEDAAKSGKENATTAEEAKAAGSKGRLASVIKKPIKVLGSAATGAVSGAVIGSIVPVIGPAIGALVGGIAGALYGLKDKVGEMFAANFPLITAFGQSLKEGISGLFKNISDWVYEKSIDITEGSGQGLKRRLIEQRKDALDFNVSKTAKNINNLGYGEKQQKLNPNQIADIQQKAVGSGILSRGFRKESVANGKGGGFKTFTEEQQSKVKQEIQDVADVYKVAGPENRKIILDAYKSQGENFKDLAKEAEIVIDEAKDDMTTAFDQLSVFFTKMKNVSELSSARISGIEGALQSFSDPSKISSDLPDQYFDILKQGIDPATLGFGATFDQGKQNLGSLAQSFDPRLLKNAEFEVSGRRAARNASTAIIDAAPTLKNTKDGDVTGFLKGRFSDANGGNTQLNDAFEKFVGSKDDTTSADLVDSEGNFNGSKVNDLFQEFADSLENGALDQMQRLNNLSKQYVDQYKGHIAARFELENEAIGLLQNNVEKRKSIDEIGNKAQGLTGDKLAAARGRQAQTADTERLGLTLQGTGLDGSATIAQIQAQLLASQQRGRNAGAIAQAGGGTQADKDTRRAEIEAGAEEEQKRLKAALTLTANGTDTLTHAMEEFERASNKAAASSKFLSDALLGSDDQMHQTVLGITAFAKVQEAFKKGGVGAAQQTLGTFGEDARQAYGAYVGQNEDLQAKSNASLGISSDISAGPEAGNVKAEIGKQIEANNALTAGLADNAKNMMANTETMKALYESQFKNASAIITQAEATSKALVDKIAALPDVIKHDMSVVVKFEGTAGLTALEPTMRKFAEDAANNALNGLLKQNSGLNKPSEPAKTTISNNFDMPMM